MVDVTLPGTCDPYRVRHIPLYTIEMIFTWFTGSRVMDSKGLGSSFCEPLFSVNRGAVHRR